MSNMLNNSKLMESGLVSIVKEDFFLSFLNASKGNTTGQNPKNDQDSLLARELASQEASSQQHQSLQQSLAHLMNPHFEGQKGDAIQKIEIENINEKEEEGAKPEKKRRRRKRKGADDGVNAQESEQQQKTNSKTLYVNRISHLISEKAAEEDKIDLAEDILKKNDLFKNNIENSVHPYKVAAKKNKLQNEESEGTGDKTTDKLAKNRESARNSRMRKKIYVDLLEKKVEQLTQELEAARKQIEQMAANSSNQSGLTKLLNGMVNGKQQLFDKLEKMLNSDADESEINLLIDSLRLRLGGGGNERVTVLNFFFKQIIDQLMPVHMKYLLWAAKEDKDLFYSKKENLYSNEDYDAPSKRSHIWAKIGPAINLTESQRKSILKYKKKLIQEKAKMDQLIQNFEENRKELFRQSTTMQAIVDDFRNHVTPVQAGRLLVLLDKERSRKEFSAEKLWGFAGDTIDYDDDSSSQDELDSPTPTDNFKHNKHNPYPANNKIDNFVYHKRNAGFDPHPRSPDYLESFMDLNLFRESSNYPARKKVHTEED